jgi:hypothetical protein
MAIVLITSCGTKPTLSLEKQTFAPGEEIRLTFKAPAYDEDAWIGIIPSNVPHGSESTNDEYDLDYQYLEGQTAGVMMFLAPGQVGSYDFRMHDTDGDGNEVASITFVVEIVVEGALLKIEKETFTPGEEIKVEFVAPPVFGSGAWIGIIPANIPHGSESKNDEYDIEYHYIEKRTSGMMFFTAPDEPGEYDIRMHDTDNNGNEIMFIMFKVVSE